MTGAELAQLITAFTSLLGLLVSMRNGARLKDVKTQTNGLTTALVAAAVASAHADGKVEERSEEAERQRMNQAISGAANNQPTQHQ